MPHRQKATDEQLAASYAETASVWRTADQFGMCGQSVHTRLVKLNLVKPMNIFTPAEVERLKREYAIFADAGKLQQLADAMGRTRHFLCRQAREIGLTDKKRARPYFAKWKYLSDDAAAVIWDAFKKSNLGLGQYCTKHGYDDLGFARTMKEKFGDEWEHVIELKAPALSMYRRGRAFEYRVRDHMRKLGYFVLRSPMSRSPIDLLAIARGVVVFIQCKRQGALGVTEWNELFDLAEKYGAVPLLTAMNKSGRGIDYFRLIGRKDGSKQRQPYEPYVAVAA